MIRICTFLIVVTLVGCDREAPRAAKVASPARGLATTIQARQGPARTLAEARKGFRTNLARRESAGEPVPQPPQGVFGVVRYEAPVGKLAAYLSPDPGDGAKHPAIVWITGGDCNTIGDVWSPAAASNDQTARPYREAGIVMMFPSLRGGNDNSGVKEGFLGEVDDVLAAAEFLAAQGYVDPGRIYLGGHSTGGTLALLVAEVSGRFRAVFAFGPADDVRGYGTQFNPFDLGDEREAEVRSPGLWLASIRSPTFVIEGTERGNIGALRDMARESSNPNAHFLGVRGANHFDVLDPANRLIAAKILRDTGPTCDLAFTEEELSRPFGR